MSREPNARLFWGIIYNEDSDDDRDDEDGRPPGVADDIEDLADELEQEIKRAAVPEPTTQDYRSPKWDEWRTRVAAWEPNSAEMKRRGYSDYSKPYVQIVGSEIEVTWSETAAITPPP